MSCLAHVTQCRWSTVCCVWCVNFTRNSHFQSDVAANIQETKNNLSDNTAKVGSASVQCGAQIFIFMYVFIQASVSVRKLCNQAHSQA